MTLPPANVNPAAVATFGHAGKQTAHGLRTAAVAGSCVEGLAAVASVLPGRVLTEAGATAALRSEALDDPMGDGGVHTDPDTTMPCLLRLSRIERGQGRYPVTAGFLRMLEALLFRHCTDVPLQVRHCCSHCQRQTLIEPWALLCLRHSNTAVTSFMVTHVYVVC